MLNCQGDAAIGSSLKWTEAFSVGYDELDEDHRRLVKAVNDICGAYRAGHPAQFLHSLLEALVRETEKHFKHENAVMLEIYNDAKRLMPDEIYNDAKRLMPDEVKAMTDNAIKEHIAEHKQTLSRLQTITRAASPNTADTASSLCMELQQWFIEHAVKYDSHLKAIFQAM